jgi:hypothetical protein
MAELHARLRSVTKVPLSLTFPLPCISGACYEPVERPRGSLELRSTASPRVCNVRATWPTHIQVLDDEAGACDSRGRCSCESWALEDDTAVAHDCAYRLSRACRTYNAQPKE